MHLDKREVGIVIIVLVVASALTFIAVPRLFVSGNGVVYASPDEAQVSFTVKTDNASVAAAASRNSQIANQVIAALTSQGISKQQIQTLGYSLMPSFDPNNYSRITGYEVSNSFQVTIIGDLTSVGGVVDTVANAGVNQIDGVTFTFTDATMSNLRNHAYQKAVQDASNQAHAIVSALGEMILGVASVSTTYSPTPIPYTMQVTPPVASNMKTPINPGNVQLTASVDVTYFYI